LESNQNVESKEKTAASERENVEFKLQNISHNGCLLFDLCAFVLDTVSLRKKL